MTERRPPGVDFETWIDKQIRDAAERGEFDNLPGAGKPLPGAGTQDDENWWLRNYLDREGVTGETVLPPPLVLRREIEELPDTVRLLRSEQRVREVVADLNKRIVECMLQPSELRIPLRRVNADAVAERWRAAHTTVDGQDPAERGPEPADRPTPVSRQRWWHRLTR